MTLVQALKLFQDDELVEVTPEAIRICKLYLLGHECKTASPAAKKTDRLI